MKISFQKSSLPDPNRRLDVLVMVQRELDRDGIPAAYRSKLEDAANKLRGRRMSEADFDNTVKMIACNRVEQGESIDTPATAEVVDRMATTLRPVLLERSLNVLHTNELRVLVPEGTKTEAAQLKIAFTSKADMEAMVEAFDALDVDRLQELASTIDQTVGVARGGWAGLRTFALFAAAIGFGIAAINTGAGDNFVPASILAGGGFYSHMRNAADSREFNMLKAHLKDELYGVLRGFQRSRTEAAERDASAGRMATSNT